MHDLEGVPVHDLGQDDNNINTDEMVKELSVVVQTSQLKNAQPIKTFCAFGSFLWYCDYDASEER